MADILIIGASRGLGLALSIGLANAGDSLWLVSRTRPEIDAANALCRRIHGHARAGELRAALEQGTAMVVERGARVTGYTTGVGFFGHAVGETDEDVWALIASAPSFAGPGFLLPTRNAALMRWSLQQGLRIVQPMTLMTMGPYEEPKGAFLPSILY